MQFMTWEASNYYHYDDGHRLASATGNSDKKNGQQVPLQRPRSMDICVEGAEVNACQP
jgi:hypothetical protein